MRDWKKWVVHVVSEMLPNSGEDEKHDMELWLLSNRTLLTQHNRVHHFFWKRWIQMLLIWSQIWFLGSYILLQQSYGNLQRSSMLIFCLIHSRWHSWYVPIILYHPFQISGLDDMIVDLFSRCQIPEKVFIMHWKLLLKKEQQLSRRNNQAQSARKPTHEMRNGERTDSNAR